MLDMSKIREMLVRIDAAETALAVERGKWKDYVDAYALRVARAVDDIQNAGDKYYRPFDYDVTFDYDEDGAEEVNVWGRCAHHSIKLADLTTVPFDDLVERMAGEEAVALAAREKNERRAKYLELKKEFGDE
jgi:hypothetical protein